MTRPSIPAKATHPNWSSNNAEVLPEITAAGKHIAIAQDYKLLDGKHRWLAYRKRYEQEDPEFQVQVYPVTSPHEQFEIAVRLNNNHGLQLSPEDKRQDAITMYGYGWTYDRIAAALSVGKATVQKWLSRTVKEEKDKREAKIFDLWLACHTQQEIAEAVGVHPTDKCLRISGHEYLKTENQKAAAQHATGFEVSIYNIWRQQEKTPGSAHFGNSEVRWLDNLLYLYTQPFDVVCDPFAGGGSTIDLCRKRFRRYFVSDRKPIVEREQEIRRHDLTEGLPKVPRWKDVKLVFLDPPYWLQAAGQYSADPTDLANMELEEFHGRLAGLITDYGRKLSAGSHLALMIQPTQWKAPQREFQDHVLEVARRVQLPITMRYSAPYESQQCNAQMVEWAKSHRQCLVLTREVIVWKVT